MIVKQQQYVDNLSNKELSSISTCLQASLVTQQSMDQTLLRIEQQLAVSTPIVVETKQDAKQDNKKLLEGFRKTLQAQNRPKAAQPVVSMAKRA
jgi:hypothetical protein